jgi:hypothetical protein
MSLSKPNRAQSLELDQRVLGAVDHYLGGVASLTLLGTSYTPGALKALLQAEIDGLAAKDSKLAAYRVQVQLTLATSAKARGLRKALRGYILNTYGATAVDVLQAFGIPVPSPKPPLTAEAKAKAVAKAAATRKARHTMGKKQKLQITAEPVVLPTPKP